MNIVTVETGLFPDQDKVNAALEALAAEEHTITRITEGEIATADEAVWDMVVREIMKADKVITI